MFSAIYPAQHRVDNIEFTLTAEGYELLHECERVLVGPTRETGTDRCGQCEAEFISGLPKVGEFYPFTSLGVLHVDLIK